MERVNYKIKIRPMRDKFLNSQKAKHTTLQILMKTIKFMTKTNDL